MADQVAHRLAIDDDLAGCVEWRGGLGWTLRPDLRADAEQPAQ
jgi:hypothetical protein